jgi:invasion protein IalB
MAQEGAAVKFHFSLVIAFLAAALAGSPALAAAAPPAQQMERYDDWQMRCFAVKSVSPCDAFFGTFQKTTGLRIATVSIAYAPARRSYLMQIAVPFGIAVQQGVVVKAGDFKSATLEVRRCDRNGCYVEGGVDGALIEALAANDGRKGSLDVVADGGKPVSLLLSLKGFAKAHEAMVKAAREKIGVAAAD